MAASPNRKETSDEIVTTNQQLIAWLSQFPGDAPVRILCDSYDNKYTAVLPLRLNTEIRYVTKDEIYTGMYSDDPHHMHEVRNTVLIEPVRPPCVEVDYDC